MEVGAEMPDSMHRIQANGPRVSFNRDVHVKRIGNRLNDTENLLTEATNFLPRSNLTTPFRRELPPDLSDESILKEAALVLAQAEGIHCKAENENGIVGGRLSEKSKGRIQRRDTPDRVPNRFHSLPNRKGKTTKPVARSVSDVSSKKSKKPSIFSIFSRKSEPNLNQVNNANIKSNSNDKLIVRNKKDGISSRDTQKPNRKRIIGDNEDTFLNITKTTQLSPIIENTQRENYFEHDGVDNRESKQSQNDSEGHRNLDSNLNFKKNIEAKNNPPEKLLKSVIVIPEYREFGSLPRNAKKNQQLFQSQSKSLEDMHCSQLPPVKPPLTKGLTVNGLVKRLSMERFSPPPQLSSPGFSYIRPQNEKQVIYAQVICDSENKSKQNSLSDSDYQNVMEPTENSQKIQDKNLSYRNTLERGAISSQKQSELKVKKVAEARNRSSSPQKVKEIDNSYDPMPRKFSHRNLSDEDEGLGLEPRKFIEQRKTTGRKPADEIERRLSGEPPIIPVIRNLSPIDDRLNLADRGRADGMDSKRYNCYEPYNEFYDLSFRRAALESKIRNRRLGSREPESSKTPEREYRNLSADNSGEYFQEIKSTPKYFQNEWQEKNHTPTRDNMQKYHKLNSVEIYNKYSPERSHLDMTSPVKGVKSSRYDESSAIRETYETENFNEKCGEAQNKDSHKRERIKSSTRKQNTDIGHGKDAIVDVFQHESSVPKGNTFEYREISLCSPENQKNYKKQMANWETSNKNSKHQKWYDKGDSGIENDFRKESFSRERSPRWNNRTVEGEILACEMFLKKERRHSEDLYRKRYDFVYRERSIDDGSHFDPRLDKYPKSSLRKKNETDRYSSPNRDINGTLKSGKKTGSLEKVKQLFSSSSKKKLSKEQKGGTLGDMNKTNRETISPTKSYMVHEEEMRQRYNEYRPQVNEPTIADIASRRRLSTPKASPLLKRTSSEKSSKPSPLALRDDSTLTKAEKFGWFKSIDRRIKKKTSPKPSPRPRTPITTTTTTEDEHSTLRVKKSSRPPISTSELLRSEKSLRFFGDTDLEENPTIHRKTSTQRIQPSSANLNRNQKYSQSAYHLDRITNSKPHVRSNSLQNLDRGADEVDRPRRYHHSRSRELQDISESASDSEIPKNRKYANRNSSLRVERESFLQQKDGERVNRKFNHQQGNERSSPVHKKGNSESTRIEFKKPPPGPQSHVRSKEKRSAYSREKDRFQDSSGTEGESSLQSQRSVVYLHATTVGAIPQPYFVNSRRRAMSREEISAIKKKEKTQPMTRTVSRSVSMLAPWKPKHLRDGYEINYSQEPSDIRKQNATLQRKSTSNIDNKKTKNNNTLQRPKNRSSSDDDLLLTRRFSSSANVSRGSQSVEKQRTSDPRKDTLSRRKVK